MKPEQENLSYFSRNTITANIINTRKYANTIIKYYNNIIYILDNVEEFHGLTYV